MILFSKPYPVPITVAKREGPSPTRFTGTRARSSSVSCISLWEFIIFDRLPLCFWPRRGWGSKDSGAEQMESKILSKTVNFDNAPDSKKNRS